MKRAEYREREGDIKDGEVNLEDYGRENLAKSVPLTSFL